MTIVRKEKEEQSETGMEEWRNMHGASSGEKARFKKFRAEQRVNDVAEQLRKQYPKLRQIMEMTRMHKECTCDLCIRKDVLGEEVRTLRNLYSELKAKVPDEHGNVRKLLCGAPKCRKLFTSSSGRATHRRRVHPGMVFSRVKSEKKELMFSVLKEIGLITSSEDMRRFRSSAHRQRMVFFNRTCSQCGGENLRARGIERRQGRAQGRKFKCMDCNKWGIEPCIEPYETNEQKAYIGEEPEEAKEG